MTTKKRQSRVGRVAALAATLLLAGTGCQDLFVENLIEPDRDRALSNPSDIEALIGSAFFPNFFRPVHGTDGGLSGLTISLWTYAASDFTSTLSGTTSEVWYQDLREPRREHPNHPVICSTICEWGPRDYWARIGAAASILYDGLQVLDTGIEIRHEGVDFTPRAQAFGKFMQGWTWGYTALVFDRIHVIPESQAIPETLEELFGFASGTLVDSKDAILASVLSIDEAIDVAQANPGVVTFPAADATALWFGSPEAISSDKFIRMANTLAARLLVLSARDPQDRANGVDWQRVLQYTANGMQPGETFEIALSTNRTSQVLQRIQNNSPAGATNARLDYRTIGMADQSGAYQAWIAADPESRTRFNIVTPDRRITGDTPTSNGAYTAYRADNNGFVAERGSYFLSAYQWQRHKYSLGLSPASNVTGLNQGSHAMITGDENALLRAEALLRTGNAAGAADMVNVTRTRSRLLPGSTTPVPGLPPVTAAGVPTVDGACVPRQDNGDCGTLMTAIRYERMLELAGIDALRGYADSRGWGMLADGSPLLFPVPGNVLSQYDLTVYTYGGVGNEGSAVYAPVN
jgi:hypothetical protein